jgi:hypothetical protein
MTAGDGHSYRTEGRSASQRRRSAKRSGVIDRIQEPLRRVVVEHDPRALGEDLGGAFARGPAIELAQTHAERARRDVLDSVLVLGDADLDPASRG